MSYLDPPVDPYDPNIADPEPQTLPLDEIIRRAVKGILLGMKVCFPAKIVSISGNQTVTVQPLLQSRYIDGQVVTIPPIQNVPVSMPRGADYWIKLPIQVGDTGHCIVSDRSLDAWLAGNGGIVDPQDSRQHDLSDAIFVPGLTPTALQTTDSTTDLIVSNGSAQLHVQKAGTFLIKNTDQELLNLLDQLLDTLINDTFTLTMLGPMPFIDGTIELLTQIREKLDTLKGS